MIVTKKVEIKELFLPNYEYLCPMYHTLILKNANHKDKGAVMTDWMFQPLRPIADFVIGQLVKDNTYKNKLVATDFFGQYYDIGHHQDWHDHMPGHYSFVLFTNTPKGSSKLCFEDFSVEPERGKIVVIPGDMYHHVPENKGEFRSVVVGNLQYRLERE